MTDSLHITLLQTEPRLGDTDGNVQRLIEAATQSPASSVAGPRIPDSPELSLTGYDLRDRPPDSALTPAEAATRVAGAGSIVIGFPERAADGAVYNSGAHVDGGRVVHVHRKVYL